MTGIHHAISRKSKAIFPSSACFLVLLLVVPEALRAQTIELDYNFRSGALGWTGDFASYPPATNSSGFYQLESGIRYAPRKLTYVPVRSFYIQGSSHSASLIMFLKRRLNASDGIVA